MEEIRLMNVLLDVYVLLDIFLEREPWFENARAIWDAHHHRKLVVHLPAHGLTNLFYIARRSVETNKAREAVRLCLKTFDVIGIGRKELEEADNHPGVDFEDNLVMACASIARLEAIVTRDSAGFAASPLQILSPTDLLARLNTPL